jgi:hypothetical protein
LPRTLLGQWDFTQAKLLSSFSATNLTLAARVSGSAIAFPTTSKGDLVIFDGNDGHKAPSVKVPLGNHGFHLGVIKPGKAASFLWQASPWGTWQLDNASTTIDGINATRYFISPETMDGRFGTGARFPTEFYTQGCHACSLEAIMRVTNDIPLGCSLLLLVGIVNCIQTLKVRMIRSSTAAAM